MCVFLICWDVFCIVGLYVSLCVYLLLLWDVFVCMFGLFCVSVFFVLHFSCFVCLDVFHSWIGLQVWMLLFFACDWRYLQNGTE